MPPKKSQKELPGSKIIEIVSNKLYFKSTRRILKDTKEFHYVTLDDKFHYTPFYPGYDFGPINLGQTFFFCQLMDHKMKDVDQKICLLSSYLSHSRSNAVYLTCAYLVIRHGMTPEDAWKPFKHMYPPLLPFRDASESISTFDLTVLDCLRGLTCAMKFKFFDYNNFNGEEYLFYEQVENGDLNWIIPKRCLAFAGPRGKRLGKHRMYFTPEDYVPMFKDWGITGIVRFNKKVYDRKRFLKKGFQHYDMIFPDGGVPNEAIVKKFLDVWESESCVACHCKAGLGRTGTLIGLALMKEFGMTAEEVIAWLRIVRPGSVIGFQQHFLKDMQEKMWKKGKPSSSSPIQPDSYPSDKSRLTAGTRSLLQKKRQSRSTTSSSKKRPVTTSGVATVTRSTSRTGNRRNFRSTLQINRQESLQTSYFNPNSTMPSNIKLYEKRRKLAPLKVKQKSQK